MLKGKKVEGKKLHAEEKNDYQKNDCNNDNFFINDVRHDANIK